MMVSLVRKLQLGRLADRIRFYFHFAVHFLSNRHFSIAHPGFVFPPAYYLYETYRLDYAAYYNDGRQTAVELIRLLLPWKNLHEKSSTVMDWGCGPGRVVRHLPGLLERQEGIYGTDYNAEYIRWNNRNIPGVKFLHNELLPPLDLKSNSLDVIYGLSIITHLSPSAHEAWVNEFHRLLKPGGILLLTTHGQPYREQLMAAEAVLFDAGQLVVRESSVEGHRVYAAFQPSDYMKRLLVQFVVLRFIEGGSESSIHGLQDTWIVQKPSA